MNKKLKQHYGRGIAIKYEFSADANCDGGWA